MYIWEIKFVLTSSSSSSSLILAGAALRFAFDPRGGVLRFRGSSAGGAAPSGGSACSLLASPRKEFLRNCATFSKSHSYKRDGRAALEGVMTDLGLKCEVNILELLMHMYDLI